MSDPTPPHDIPTGASRPVPSESSTPSGTEAHPDTTQAAVDPHPASRRPTDGPTRDTTFQTEQQSDPLRPGPVRPDSITGSPDGTRGEVSVGGVESVPPEVIEHLKKIIREEKMPPETLARWLAEQGAPKEKVQELLKEAYDDMNPGKAREITESLRSSFVEPAPESPEDREKREVLEHALQEDFGPKLDSLMTEQDEEKKITGIQKLLGRLQGMFDNDGMRALGGVLKFSIKGLGLLGLLFMLLMKMYGGGGGK